MAFGKIPEDIQAALKTSQPFNRRLCTDVCAFASLDVYQSASAEYSCGLRPAQSVFMPD